MKHSEVKSLYKYKPINEFTLDTFSIAQHINTFNEKINQRIKRAGILSLAEDPSDLLMWAHYSDDHKGVCIEFERHENNLLGNDETTKKVNYTKYYPSISKSVLLKSNGLEHVRRILWTKSEQWRYENEWRTIILEGGQVKNIPGAVKSITFGMRCSQISIDIIKQLVRGNNIQLRQAKN